MINPGLTSVEMARLIETLCGPHHVKVIVSMTDLNHNHLFNLTGMLYDGQVNIGANNDITRSATLSIWDPARKLGIELGDPNSGALYYNRMMQVTYCVWRFGDTKSVDIPIFCGPVIDFTPVGGFANVSCVGKELLSKGAIWATVPYTVGTNRGSLIKAIMRDRGGETKFDLTATTSKLTTKITYVRNSVIWDEMAKMARAAGQYLFYDGRGVLRMRPYPASTSFVFRDGLGGTILSEPSIKYDDQEFINAAWLVGGAPSKNKAAVQSTKYLPATHPLNHNRIGRKVGSITVPRVLPIKIEDSSVTSQKVADQRAQAAVDAAALQQLTASVNVLTIPLLEEGDILGVKMGGRYAVTFRMQDATIPLVGAASSVGTMKNLALKART